MSAEIHEECGVFGIFASEKSNIAADIYYGLYALQHRGQESCGIVVNRDGVFSSHKDIGLVGDVFSGDAVSKLGPGNIAIGHVRYGTTGGGSRANCQPIEVRHIKGSMAIAHNGNLTNSAELRLELELNGSIFHTTSDTEIIAYTVTKERLTHPSIEEAVEAVMERLDGAYSLIIMSPSKLLAVRDKHGFRPLCYGMKPDGSYVIASESCALSSVGADFVRDIRPGEILIFSRDGINSVTTHCGKARNALCLFEYIYFARPDSVIDGISVQEAHLRAGEFLAK